MTSDIDRYERAGKHAVNVGDLVSVAGTDTQRGWTNARVVAFTVNDDGSVTASVTRPKNRAGLRYVAATRLTRQSGVK